jgi:hypothetical protein
MFGASDVIQKSNLVDKSINFVIDNKPRNVVTYPLMVNISY